MAVAAMFQPSPPEPSAVGGHRQVHAERRACERAAARPVQKMKWYKFPVTEYRSQIGHLVDAEDLAFRRLLDWYWMSEQPIPADQIASITKLDIEESERVLKDFFVLKNGCYHLQWVDEEIVKRQDRTKLNQKSGKLGGRPKKSV